MADMPWREAIVKVLQDSGSPMHYAEIAQAISDSGYRVNVGATPANTVWSESVRLNSVASALSVRQGGARRVHAARDDAEAA